MKTYINNNAQAHLFRAKHEKAYFMMLGSATTLHPMMITASTVFLGLSIAAFAALGGKVSPEVGFTAILVLCFAGFVASAGLMFAAASRARKLLSALRQPDFADVEAAGIFKIQTKAVK